MAKGGKRVRQTGEPVQLIAVLWGTDRELGNLSRGYSIRELSHIIVFPLLGSEVPDSTFRNGSEIHTIEGSISFSDFIIHGVQIGTLGNPVGQNHITHGLNAPKQVLHPAVANGIIQIRNQRELEVEKPLTHSGISVRVKRRGKLRMGGVIGRSKFRRLAITEPAFEIRHTATGKINNCHNSLLLLVNRVESPITHSEGFGIDNFRTPSGEELIPDTKAVRVVGNQTGLNDVAGIGGSVLVASDNIERQGTGLVTTNRNMNRFNGLEAKELMVPHTGDNTAALTAPFGVGVIAHSKVGTEDRRHDNKHTAVNPTLLLNQGTLEIGEHHRQILRGDMHRITRSAKVDVMETASGAERGKRGNLSHHTAKNETPLLINIGLVDSFKELLFIIGPAVTGLFNIERVELNILIRSEANLKTARFRSNGIGNKLLVLLIGTHRPDFRSAHKLNNLVALRNRLKKLRVGDTGKPVFLIDFGKDNVAVPNSGKRGCFHSGITGRTGKHRHKLFS
nr:MAG TPA: hypothetical protein [Caudoviricetes sp.]